MDQDQDQTDDEVNLLSTSEKETEIVDDIPETVPKVGELSVEGLHYMLARRSFEHLDGFHGINGLATSLKTDLKTGLNSDATEDLQSRVALYGVNKFDEPPVESWLEIFANTFKDTTMIILTVSAGVSLLAGIVQQFLSHPGTSWVEGVAILVAVVLVATVTATNDYSKSKQFRDLHKQNENVLIRVLRNSEQQTISIFDIVVGDVVVLVQGSKLPADGLFIPVLEDIWVDESTLTGEPEPVHKSEKHPFVLSGCNIVRGSGLMLVTSVGMNTVWGRTIATLPEDISPTPLQEKLELLAVTIGKIGTVAAVLVFIVLFGYYIAHNVVDPHIIVDCNNQTDVPSPEIAPSPDSTMDELINQTNSTLPLCSIGKPLPGVPGKMYISSKFQPSSLLEVLEAFIVAVTIVVVAVPEGLPLAVTIALAYSMKLMAEDKNLVRHLSACETMGGATVICTDKTGTLTENRMTVVRGWIAGQTFDSVPEFLAESEFDKLRPLIIRSCCCNNDSGHIVQKEGKPLQFFGSTTECALLVFAEKLGADYKEVQKQTKTVRKWAFTSQRKLMSSVIELSDSNGSSSSIKLSDSSSASSTLRLLCKGGSEKVLSLCSHLLDKKMNTNKMSDITRKEIHGAIEAMAEEGLRTICIAYRDIHDSSDLFNNTTGKGYEENLVFVGILGIEDPIRPEVPLAVLKCKEAGITVRMVTGDNITTAKKIAKECNILSAGGKALEGEEFAKLSDEELDAILPKLEVLARLTPEDKYRIVNRLKENGEVVAVTGDGTNDAAALRAADVGLAMNITGSDVAKHAADIIILDDNFASIVKSVMWGRCVFDNIRKFLQFQLTVNTVALIVAFLGAVSNFGTPLTAVQLLWVNLIMDSLAALALGTEKPTEELLQRKPYGREGKLLTFIMYRNIVFQALFQITVLAVILYAVDSSGHHLIFTELDSGKALYDLGKPSLHYTFLFNTFVFCQVFNEINSRRVSPGLNVFTGIITNKFFVGIIIGICVVQVLLISFGGMAAKTVPLPFTLWIYSVIIGALSLPIGFLVRLIPVPLEHWEIINTEKSERFLVI